MNVRMWDHPATQRNLATLRSDGVAIVGPNEGDMACGEYGPGRMAEPAEIVTAIQAQLPRQGPLAGQRVLVTAGPTHEPIDPVRYIANRSSGTQGLAIATALRDQGADVVLICGPVNLPMPDGVEVHQVESAEQMLAATRSALPVQAGVFAAAVADWRVASSSDSKIKKDSSGAPPPLTLAENPDILKTISALPPGQRPVLVVGFAAETDDVIANATAKRLRKGCDWIVANDVSPETGIMGGTENTVTLITDGGPEHWPSDTKDAVAARLAARIADALVDEAVA